MWNVCVACGEYSEEKIVDETGPEVICPFCDHRQPFVMLPLFVITGASGTGKTTICQQLSTVMIDCVFIECDILWRPEFNKPHNDYFDFRNTCLRVAKNINQSGRPTVLCGSATPGQYESCPERRYFGQIHYLALVCETAALEARLRARPAWRKSAEPEMLTTMIEYNQWFKDHIDAVEPPLTLLDTTDLTVEQTVTQVKAWLTALLEAEHPQSRDGRS